MNIDCRTMHLFLDERPLELNVTQGLKLQFHTYIKPETKKVQPPLLRLPQAPENNPNPHENGTLLWIRIVQKILNKIYHKSQERFNYLHFKFKFIYLPNNGRFDNNMRSALLVHTAHAKRSIDTSLFGTLQCMRGGGIWRGDPKPELDSFPASGLLINFSSRRLITYS